MWGNGPNVFPTFRSKHFRSSVKGRNRTQHGISYKTTGKAAALCILFSHAPKTGLRHYQFLNCTANISRLKFLVLTFLPAFRDGIGQITEADVHRLPLRKVRQLSGLARSDCHLHRPLPVTNKTTVRVIVNTSTFQLHALQNYFSGECNITTRPDVWPLTETSQYIQNHGSTTYTSLWIISPRMRNSKLTFALCLNSALQT